MKFLRIAIAAATLATASFATMETASAFPGHCGPFGHHCIRGIIIHRHCVAWEVFGGERHCVRWARGW